MKFSKLPCRDWKAKVIGSHWEGFSIKILWKWSQLRWPALSILSPFHLLPASNVTMMAGTPWPYATTRQLWGWKPDVPDDWAERKKEPVCLTASQSCHTPQDCLPPDSRSMKKLPILIFFLRLLVFGFSVLCTWI